MTKRARRILIPLAIGVVAIALVLLPWLFDPARQADDGEAGESVATAQDDTRNDDNGSASAPQDDSEAGTADDTDSDTPDQDVGEEQAQPPGDEREPEEQDEATGEERDDLVDAPLADLHAVAPSGGFGESQTPTPIGSLDWREAQFRIELSTRGAGISRLIFSDIWNRAQSKRIAEDVKARIEADEATLDEMPDDRYILVHEQTFQGATRPIAAIAARAIRINSEPYINLDADVWSEVEPGVFACEIRNGDDQPILRLTRRFHLSDSFDIGLVHDIENLTTEPLDVEFVQYGPGDLEVDRSRYMDRRRYRIAYRIMPANHPDLIATDDLLLERADVQDMVVENRAAMDVGAQTADLWPTEESRVEGYDLTWFASTNRYFAFAVHPSNDATAPFDKSLGDTIARIYPTGDVQRSSEGEWIEPANVITEMYGHPVSVEAGETARVELGIYAGPLDRDILNQQQPYEALSMGGLILYQMSACCAICTFQWLAVLLLNFLSVLAGHVVFDWAVAIMILVVVVRACLHPITKKAQISMQRFSRAMQNLKPEIEKLQKKHSDDPKRMQMEQMRLMREHGVNPFGCLGFLPMFLQMPIWIALYAMLYFAYDLRQEAAFWGLFQNFGHWQFLADLSSADHFFWELSEPILLVGIWNITGINLLPFLMGALFFVQQKYLSPPPSPNMSKEMQQQQKIMKVLMVVLFPIMLYSAPSGLTLYILTSSTIGIIESRYIRRHVDEMDLDKKPEKKPKTKAKRKDPLARAYADALQRAKDKRKPPPKKYKKRR